MTDNVATVRQLVDVLGGEQVVNPVGNADFWHVYNNNHVAIDAVLKSMYGNYVLPDISSPFEVDKYVIVDESTKISEQFVAVCEKPLERLWELESVTFNPIENYDRYEKLSHVKTGSEEVSGGNKADNIDSKADTGTDTETVTQNGGVTNANSGGITSEEKTSDTSYNTNLINTVANNTTDTTTTVTEYNELETKTNTEKGTTTTYTYKVDETHNETKIYNAVTDAEENHIHGNIGVTTATAMMTEFVSFYDSYNFWLKFWEMYIKMFASPIFETDRRYYI